TAAELSLQGTVDAGTIVKFLDTSSGTLRLGNAAARTSFESHGTIASMNVGAVATDVIDLADILPGSITSGAITNGNTIQLYNGATAIDHFTLAGAPGAAFVKWTSDGSGGTDIFLSKVA